MVKIQVIGCDVCRQAPALTYGITASDGRSIAADLCPLHGESIEALLADFGQVGEVADEVFEPEPTPAVEPEPAKAAPTKAAPRKAVTRKAPAPAKKATAGRRRPKITPLEDIEALKNKG